MSFESGSSFSGEGVSGGGLPPSDDIQLTDCTMSVIAADKHGIPEATDLLQKRIVEVKGNNSTVYDCKACLGKFADAGFANIDGAPSCRSKFLSAARLAIAEV